PAAASQRAMRQGHGPPGAETPQARLRARDRAGAARVVERQHARRGTRRDEDFEEKEMKRILVAIPLLLLAAACGNGKTVVDAPRPVLTQTVIPGASSTREVYSGEIRARHE